MLCRWCSTEKAPGSECKPECRLWQFVEDNEMRPWIAELLPIVHLVVRDLRVLRGSRPINIMLGDEMASDSPRARQERAEAAIAAALERTKP